MYDILNLNKFRPENYFKNIALRSKINEKIFFNLVKEEEKTQILTSFIGSVSKMLLHTSIIGIFEQHDISYKELKSIITLKKNIKSQILHMLFP